MAKRVRIVNVSREALREPVTKGDLAEFMTQVRLQGVLTDSAIMAAFSQDREKLLEYLDKLSKHYETMDISYNVLLGMDPEGDADED